MSGKFLARASALSLAMLLAACGGGDDSTPLVDSNDSDPTGGGTETGAGTGDEQAQEIALGIGSGDSFTQGQMESEIGSNTLSSGGQTTLKVYVVDAADGYSLVSNEEVTVTFSSNCGSEADITSPIVTSNGVAEATYTNLGCNPVGGQDSVTAETNGAEAKAVINLAVPEAERIVSNPLSITSIAPNSVDSSDRPSTAPVSFNVVDASGEAGLAGVDVSFSLTGDDPNAETPVTLSQQQDTSTSGGLVSTTVVAGSASTTVRVIASIDGTNITTQSDPIAINSLLPTENGFTLTSDNYIPDAQFTAGVEVPISVFATDKNGQDVRGDTIVNFTTTGGSITPDCQLSENGICTVTWRSQAPWLTEPVITATTIGETNSGAVGTISQNLSLFVSSSRNPDVQLANGTESQQYCATATVEDPTGNKIHPADGTTVDFSISDGEILSAETSKKVIGAEGVPGDKTKFVTCIYAKLSDPTSDATLTATMTTPGGSVDEAILIIPATTP